MGEGMKYRCKTCAEILNSRKEIRKHVRMMHGKYPSYSLGRNADAPEDCYDRVVERDCENEVTYHGTQK